MLLSIAILCFTISALCFWVAIHGINFGSWIDVESGVFQHFHNKVK